MSVHYQFCTDIFKFVQTFSDSVATVRIYKPSTMLIYMYMHTCTGSGGFQGEGQSSGQAAGGAQLPERETGRGQQDFGQA